MMSRASISSACVVCVVLAAALCAAACKGEKSGKREQDKAPAAAPAEVAKAAVQELAGPLYQRWSAANPRRPCPNIDELVELAPKLARDPWGQKYHARCSAEALAGTVREVMISSNGPDGLTNTDDDIKSK